MTKLFATKVNCPELYKAVEAIGIKYGYQYYSYVVQNVNNPYIGFHDNKKMDTCNISYDELYLKSFDVSTQWNKFIQELEKENIREWKIGCDTVVFDGKKLVIENNNCVTKVSYNTVKEIYEAITKAQGNV